MNYAAWGVSWLGSWGQSWGPLHEVAETWDTTQGIARNKTTLIKFAPIQDIEQVLYEQRVETAVWVMSPIGDAAVEFRGDSCGSYHGSFFGVIQANAYAEFRADPVVSTSCIFVPGADSGATLCFGGVVSSGAGFILAADAGFFEWGSPEMSTSMPRFSPFGVQNPTDEQLAYLAAHIVLTSKQKAGISRYG